MSDKTKMKPKVFRRKIQGGHYQEVSDLLNQYKGQEVYLVVVPVPDQRDLWGKDDTSEVVRLAVDAIKESLEKKITGTLSRAIKAVLRDEELHRMPK